MRKDSYIYVTEILLSVNHCMIKWFPDSRSHKHDMCFWYSFLILWTFCPSSPTDFHHNSYTRNNKRRETEIRGQTAEACIVNASTLLFVALYTPFLFIIFSIFSILPSLSRGISFTVRFTLPLLLLIHPPPPLFSSFPLSSNPPAISYLPQGEAGEDAAALGAQEPSQHLCLDSFFLPSVLLGCRAITQQTYCSAKH